MVPVEDAPPVELPAPVEVAPVELAAPVELPVELAPVPVVAEPALRLAAEVELAVALEPFPPIDPEIVVRTQAAFKPTNRRQATIWHFTLEDCAQPPDPSRVRESFVRTPPRWAEKLGFSATAQ